MTSPMNPATAALAASTSAEQSARASKVTALCERIRLDTVETGMLSELYLVPEDLDGWADLARRAGVSMPSARTRQLVRLQVLEAALTTHDDPFAGL